MNVIEQLTKARDSKRKVTLNTKDHTGQQVFIKGWVTLVRPKAIGFIQDTPLDKGSSGSKTFCRNIMLEDIFEVVV